MSGTFCFLASLGVVAIGALAMYVGFKNDNMAAKTGGNFIAVIGILGAVACAATALESGS